MRLTRLAVGGLLLAALAACTASGPAPSPTPQVIQELSYTDKQFFNRCVDASAVNATYDLLTDSEPLVLAKGTQQQSDAIWLSATEASFDTNVKPGFRFCGAKVTIGTSADNADFYYLRGGTSSPNITYRYQLDKPGQILFVVILARLP